MCLLNIKILEWRSATSHILLGQLDDLINYDVSIDFHLLRELFR